MPRLHIPGKPSLQLPLTSCGHPIIPAKNDVVIVEGEEFTVVRIEWDYDNDWIDVFSERKGVSNARS